MGVKGHAKGDVVQHNAFYIKKTTITCFVGLEAIGDQNDILPVVREEDSIFQ